MDEKDYKCEDWQRHYEENDLGWDLGQVAPPFVKLWQEEKLPLGKVLVPGCGRGHEVVFLAENGFDVTAIDFSSGAVTYLKNALKKRNLEGRILHQDFFSLDESHEGVYDLVLEQTFFCAISPKQRRDYVLNVSRILKPGGILVGLFYHTDEQGGPPYNTTREDIEMHFSKKFEIQELDKTSLSAEQRKDKEWLGILKKPENLSR
ncbi:MAG TPA: methyltransferase domain-containing protein [Nitrospinaceae bacterium]|jgi:SAM-dependent methyltransferase|nr:methyltransferase domain-containing protein [Nitrospinaceae bacterium]HIE79519.1 methyltransferase domain-containing protein [Nitrospinaceae bacterium]|tara:strand:- start:471 stop:1085 length:615 start_codon:yes stop_codon:yes gene_type:complete